MREIKYIFVHCTATKSDAKLSAILRFWKQSNGWKMPGYHKIVFPDGKCVRLLPDEKVSNGVQHYNSNSLNICYIGGFKNGKDNVDTRTPEQKETLEVELRKWKYLYPDAEILGHRNRSTKNCPNFDAQWEYRNI